MKLRTLDRIILLIGAFLVALIGVCVFFIGLRTDALSFSDFSGGVVYVNRLLILLCGIILFAYGVYLMSLPQTYRKSKLDFVIQQTADGELRISVNAMDALVRKVMEAHQEMNLKSMEVEHRKGGVFVDLKATVAGNISIPLAVAALQKDIKQYLLSSTGVDVREVKVSIDTTDEMVKDSPYIMQETVPSPSEGTSSAAVKEQEEVMPDEPLETDISSAESQQVDYLKTFEAREGAKQDDGRN